MSETSSTLQPCKPSTLCVVGLGYIGLPTAIVCAQAGWIVTGYEVSAERVDMVNAGILPFREDGLEAVLQRVVSEGTLKASTTVIPADVYIIAVPTPITDLKEPDLSYVYQAARAIAPVLNEGNTVILESTVPMGATEEMAKIILEERPELDGKLLFAHSPERVLPGRILEEMTTNDRVVGGLTPQASQRARDIYATFCRGTISTTDARTAELVKLVENSYRDVSIAFANEISMMCEANGLNPWEVIDIANRHPRVNILQPGPGVGGHCIAVDPWFLIHGDPKRTPLMRAARSVNDYKPRHVRERVAHAIREQADDTHIAVFGLAFKANIDDLRSSPALEIATRLVNDYPNRYFHVVEPNITELPTALAGAHNVQLTTLDEALNACKIVIALVDHSPFRAITAEDLDGKTVIDTRGIWI